MNFFPRFLLPVLILNLFSGSGQSREDGEIQSWKLKLGISWLLIVPHCDRLVFQQFLDTMAEEAPHRKSKKFYLVLDNASWHKVKSLEWHHITPLFLPPYSPDLNPIERVWQHFQSHYLAGFITNKLAELDSKVEESIRALLEQPETLRSLCNTHSQSAKTFLANALLRQRSRRGNAMNHISRSSKRQQRPQSHSSPKKKFLEKRASSP